MAVAYPEPNPTPGSDSFQPWYALRVRSRHEKTIAGVLQEKGYETFLPLYISRRRWSDRIKELELPLFPGYVFCRLDITRRLPILVTPGVMGIVSSGRMFLPVDERDIANIRTVVASQLQAQPWPYVHVGQRVRVDRGPLEGVEGIVLSLKKPLRLILSVTLLQRSVAVDIECASVVAVDPAASNGLTAPTLYPGATGTAALA